MLIHHIPTCRPLCPTDYYLHEHDAPVVAALARSSRSTSSSFKTASLPCLRIQAANLGSDASVASANSFRRQSGLWNGQ